MVELPEYRSRSFFTTARIIHDPRKGEEADWLWVNASQSHQFDTEDEAQSLANLANHNGEENGMDILHYPYFVVHIAQRTAIEKVEHESS